MKKLILLLALCFSTATVFTSCRDDRSGAENNSSNNMENAAEAVDDPAEEAADN